MRERRVAMAIAGLLAVWLAVPLEAAVPGRLKVDGSNPRWLTNDTNKAVVLSGSHTWHVNQDYQSTVFNWMGFQNRIDGIGHNFYRGWTWEDTHYRPTLWKLVNGKYDLNQVNHDAWTSTSGNLRKRVRRARLKGIYTSIMLFQGWSVWNFQVGSGAPLRQDDPWSTHPFKLSNNRNGINGDFIANSTRKQGQEIHEDRGESMSNQITNLQLAYVQFVVDKMKGFKNIFWEVSNESPAGTNFRKWQNTVVDRIWQRDRNSLIMISCHTAGTSVTTLSQMLAMNSRARVIAPCAESTRGLRIGKNELTNPEAAPGDRIRVADSDHIDVLKVGEDTLWAWKYFLRGYHPIFMDLAYDLPWTRSNWNTGDPKWAQIANSLGAIQDAAATVNLRALVPQNRNVQTPVKRNGNRNRAFALYSSSSPGAGLNRPANGVEYLVLEPNGGLTIRVCGMNIGSNYDYTWTDPYSGATVASGVRQNVGNCRNFVNPRSQAGVLHVVRQ